MSPITKSGMCAVLAFSIMLLAAGCGDPKSNVFDPDRGKHKTAWLPGEHSLAVTIGTSSVGSPVYSTEQCTECHGADLNGGISSVSCTSCHLGGPTSVHPLTWDPMYLTHGPSVGPVTPASTASCANQYCHGLTLTGVANSGPSCDKNAGINGCHSIPYDPLTVICGACHRIPPDGTRFPNLAGKHGKHATSNTTSCNICHDGASSYVGDHHDNVINFSFLAAYTPRTGLTPSYNATAKTCANMSCHGGQTTPAWYTGTINVNTQCTSCHAVGTAQYNSASSGEHNKHVNGENIACTTCHDTTALAVNHFTRLDTSTMEGPASATLRTQTSYNGTSCNPSQGGLSGCHSSETW
jgi:predicted CxxxxCH...CXXCH cytochrome family protein